MSDLTGKDFKTIDQKLDELIEYVTNSPRVKSVQRGNYAGDSYTNSSSGKSISINIAISAVDPERCSVSLYGGESHYPELLGGAVAAGSSWGPTYTLTANTLTVNRGGYLYKNGSVTNYVLIAGGWEIVEH